jgi:prepilin-type processing-associated H-X9-DG protein
VFAFRHGALKAGGSADSFRFNAGFFDGHVEALDEMEGADPSLWMPTGTEVPNAAGQMYKDVYDQYVRGATNFVAN